MSLENGVKPDNQNQKVSKNSFNEFIEMKAQIAALGKEIEANKKSKEKDPTELFTALRSTLEEIAASSIKVAGADSLFTTSSRNIIDSGASMICVSEEASIRNKAKHARALLTAGEKHRIALRQRKYSLKVGHTYIRIGPRSTNL